MKSCVLWQQKQSVKPANVKRVGVLSENSVISHANEPLANHGAVCGTITEVTGMTECDDVGVFDVRHDEVTSGHLVDTGEATVLTDCPVFINESASTEVIDESSANSGSGAASDATCNCVLRLAGGSAIVGDDVISEARRSNQLIDTCVYSTMSVNELSPLKYVSVRVANDDTKENKVILALCDTGAAEICCLDAGLATDLAPNIVGQIQFRPFCGDSVNTGLARFTVALCGNDEVDDYNRNVDVWCAIVPDLHDKFILTADAVRRLSE